MAAEYIGCSLRTFDKLVKDRILPAPKLLNGIKLWDRLELDQWFENLPPAMELVNDWDA